MLKLFSEICQFLFFLNLREGKHLKWLLPWHSEVVQSTCTASGFYLASHCATVTTVLLKPLPATIQQVLAIRSRLCLSLSSHDYRSNDFHMPFILLHPYQQRPYLSQLEQRKMRKLKTSSIVMATKPPHRMTGSNPVLRKALSGPMV